MARPPWRSPVAVFVLASWSMAVLTAVPKPAAAAETSVDIVDFAFSPSAVTVDAGDTVVWTNTGAAPHTATSDAGQADSWDSGTLGTGQTFSHTFSTPGTFTYFCAIHPFMRGTVTVRQAPTATASPTPTATATAAAPTSTPEPSATATPTRTPTPVTPTPAPTATFPAATASPPAPPESVPPVSSGGDVLAASTGPPRADLPSAGHGLDSPAGPPPAAPAALASLGAAVALASLLWSRRRA